MSKKRVEPMNYLYPIPAVPISCTDRNGRSNIITVAWVGVACRVPPMVSVAIGLPRYSHKIIKETGVFCVNIPDEKTLRITDYCGNVSGKDVDKFKELGIIPAKADEIECYYINECPINMECKVRHSIVLGSHELFIGEVLAVHAKDGVITDDGRINIDNLDLFSYIGPDYYSIGNKIGQYGYSVNQPVC